MIDVEDLLALVRNYNPRSNASLIRDAYEYGMRMHEGQFRHSGEPYFTHPIAVAAILTDMRLDDATIVTALLHDTVEDTRSTKEDLIKTFGLEIADRLGIEHEAVIAVGDGANDLGMLKLAGMGVALHAKPVVAAECRLRVTHGDLTALLYLQGYTRADFA